MLDGEYSRDEVQAFRGMERVLAEYVRRQHDPARDLRKSHEAFDRGHRRHMRTVRRVSGELEGMCKARERDIQTSLHKALSTARASLQASVGRLTPLQVGMLEVSMNRLAARIADPRHT